MEGETYSAAEVSYFYHVAYNSIAQSQYASYYGLSKSTPLTQQSLSDMAKTLLGVSDDMTWDAYFRDAAKKSLIQITMLKKGRRRKEHHLERRHAEGAGLHHGDPGHLRQVRRQERG